MGCRGLGAMGCKGLSLSSKTVEKSRCERLPQKLESWNTTVFQAQATQVRTASRSDLIPWSIYLE